MSEPPRPALASAPPGRLWRSFALYLAGLLLFGVGFFVFAHHTGEAAAAAVATAGFGLLWLVPYHAIPLTLDALGWRALIRLRPESDAAASVPYLLWVASVREAVGALLPVVRIGGEVVGVHLVRRRGLPTAFAAATVVVEVTVTLVSQIALALVGLLLLDLLVGHVAYLAQALPFAVLSLAVVALFVLLQHGGLVGFCGRLLRRATGLDALAGKDGPAGEDIDQAIRRIYRHGKALLRCFAGQTLGLVAGAGEIWIAMRLMNHPVGLPVAVILEAAVQALRTGGFFVPGALGVQEVGLVFLGGVMGFPPDLMLAVSILKRLRETLYGGLALLSWQWVEGRRAWSRRRAHLAEPS